MFKTWLARFVVLAAALAAPSLAFAVPPPTDADYEAFLKMMEGPEWMNAWKKLPGAALASRCASGAGERFQIDMATPESASSRRFYEYLERECAGPIAALKSLPAREFDAALFAIEQSALIQNHWSARASRLEATPFPAAGARFDAGTEAGAALPSPVPFVPGERALGAMHKWRDSSDQFDLWFFGQSGNVTYAVQADSFRPKPEDKRYLPPSYNYNAHSFEGSLWRGPVKLSPLASWRGDGSIACSTDKEIRCVFTLDDGRPDSLIVRKSKSGGVTETCFVVNSPKPSLSCVADADGAQARKQLAAAAAAYGSDFIATGIALADHLLRTFVRPNWTAEVAALDARLRQAADVKRVKAQLYLTGNEIVECMMAQARATRVADPERALSAALANLTCNGKPVDGYYEREAFGPMRAEASRLLRAGRTLSEPEAWEFDRQGRGERAAIVMGKKGRAFDGDQAYAYAIEGKTAYGLIPLMTAHFRPYKEPVPAIAVECSTDGHPLRCKVRAPLIHFETSDDVGKFNRDFAVITFDFHSTDAPIKICVERHGRIDRGLDMASQDMSGTEPLKTKDGCFILTPGDRALSRLAWQRSFIIGGMFNQLFLAGDVEMEGPGFRLNFNERVPNFLRLLAAKLETQP